MTTSMPVGDDAGAAVPLAQFTARSSVKFGTSGARGLVADLTPAMCWAYTDAFLQILDDSGGPVVIGHDLRPSSPAIAQACCAAIAAKGGTCIYSGSLPTPAIAYAALQLRIPAMVVTGSHIPFDRNGIKFYRPSGEITKADEARMLEARVAVPETVKLAALPAVDARPLDLYRRRYEDAFAADALAGMTIGVYEHSSVARDLLHHMLRAFGATTVSLGRTDDFIPVDTEAIRPEDIALARTWASAHGLDAIVSTDGDADRPMLADEHGAWFRGDVLGLLSALALNAQVVVTPVNSNSAVESCGAFRTIIRTRIGSPYVVEAMEAAARHAPSAIAGYEANGGFLAGSGLRMNGKDLRPLPTRDALLPLLLVLRQAKIAGRGVSALAHALPKRCTHSDRLQNFAVARSQAIIAQMEHDEATLRSVMAPSSGEIAGIDRTDGLRVTFASGDIVHLRPSGNAPELRCYAESSDPGDAIELCRACLDRVAARHTDADAES